MVERLHINGFKGFNDFGINGFSKINLLYGLNNSGKTSILEAIGFGVNPEYLCENYLRNKYNHDLSGNVLTFFSSDNRLRVNSSEFQFRVTDIPVNVELPIEELSKLFPKNKIKENINLNFILTALSSNNNIIYIEHKRVEIFNDIIKELTIILGVDGLSSEILIYIYEVVDKKIKSFLSSNTQHFSIFFFPNESINVEKEFINTILDNSTLKNKVLEILQAVDNTIIDYFFNSEGKLRFKVLDSEESRPMEYMGDGIKKIFNLLNVLFASGAKTVLIDELDNGLHPMAYSKIFTLLNELSKQENIQFFITSHNPEFVKNMAKFAGDTKIEEDIRFFNVMKNREGLRWTTMHEPDYMYKLLTEQNHMLIW